MAEERVRRRLVAILVADVVGYSRLLEAGETGMTGVVAVRLGDDAIANSSGAAVLPPRG